MGLWSGLRDWLAPDFSATADAAVSLDSGELAEFSEHLQVSDLPAEVASAFGLTLDTSRVSRVHAMCLPAVRRGRAIVAGSIGSMPLAAFRAPTAPNGRAVDGDPDVERIYRALLEQPETQFPRSVTVTYMVEDLIFEGVTFLRVTGRDFQGFPVAVERVHNSRVSFDEPDQTPQRAPLPTTGKLRIDGEEVDDQDVIRIEGPDDGLLNTSSDMLRMGLDLLRTTRSLSQPNAPLTILEDERTSDDEPLTDTERSDLLSGWQTALRSRGVVYTPPNIKARNPDWDPRRLGLTEAREQFSLDVARAFNLPAAWLSASEGNSMTYKNTRDQRSELVDITLQPYMNSIADRLSMNDVTPRGQYVMFDTSRFIDGTRRERIDDAAAASGAGLMTRTEARNRYLDLPGDAPETEANDD